MSIKIYIRIYIYNTFTEKSKKTIKIARFTRMFHVKNKAHFKPTKKTRTKHTYFEKKRHVSNSYPQFTLDVYHKYTILSLWVFHTCIKKQKYVCLMYVPIFIR